MKSKVTGSFYRYVITRMLLGVVFFCLLMGMLAWGASETVADRFIEQRLTLVMEQMLKDSQVSQQLLMRNDEPWRSWTASSADLPDYLMVLRKPGIYELVHPDVHVVAALSPLDNALVFLQYTPDLDPEQLDYASSARWILLAAVMIALLTGTIMARWLAARITDPVRELKARVDQASENAPPLPLARDDELGALSESFYQSFSRLSQFIEREKQFTRYASHELRTPVTVIQGALDVLEQLSLPPGSETVLKRVRLANQDMQAFIDTFLALGREGGSAALEKEASEAVLLSDLVRQTQERFQHLRPDMAVTHYSHSSTCYVPEQAAKIVIQNLLRNAYSYGHSELRTGLRGGMLLVANDLTITDKNSVNAYSRVSGYGFGHEIVSRLCDCYGWSFTASQRGRRYRAVIRFPVT